MKSLELYVFNISEEVLYLTKKTGDKEAISGYKSLIIRLIFLFRRVGNKHKADRAGKQFVVVSLP